MGIESNKEAMAMMQRALGSMEGKIREAYNKGYHDGLKEGINQTTQKLVNRILEEVDDEQTDSEVTRNSLRTDCTGCKFVGWYDTDFPCVNCIRKNKDYYTSEQNERSE